MHLNETFQCSNYRWFKWISVGCFQGLLVTLYAFILVRHQITFLVMEAEESKSNESECLSGYFHFDAIAPFSLQNNLWKFKQQDLFCDVKLRVGEEVLSAHKVVLAAASPYFRVMFTSGLKESTENIIDLHEVDFNLLKKVIQFFYTARIKVDDGDIYEIWNLANLFQSTHLKGACKQYMYDSVCISYCLSVYEHAILFDEKDLSDFAFHFIITNFRDVLLFKTELFNASYLTMLQILSSNVVNVPSEADLFEAVRKWVYFDFPNRQAYIAPLLQKISLQRIMDKDIENLLESCEIKNSFSDRCPFYDWLVNLKETRQKIRYNDSDHCDKELLKNMKANFRCRSSTSIIFAIGGMSSSLALFRNMECLAMGWENWKCVRPSIAFVNGKPCEETRVIPTMAFARHHPAVAVHDKCIYVIGGASLDYSLSCVEVFSVPSNEWKELPSLPVSLFGCAATFSNGTLFVCGGVTGSIMDPQNMKISSSLWMYDKFKKTWIELASMKFRRVFHQLVAARNMLFAIGGKGSHYTEGSEATNAESLGVIECYDFETDSWIELSSMLESRSCFGCVAFGEYIYAIGGKKGKKALSSVERFDVFKNQWENKRPLSVGRYSMGVTLCGSRVYCCGGEDGVRHTLSTVEKYNILTDRWHSVLSMQCPRVGLVAACFTLPALEEPPP